MSIKIKTETEVVGIRFDKSLIAGEPVINASLVCLNECGDTYLYEIHRSQVVRLLFLFSDENETLEFTTKVKDKISLIVPKLDLDDLQHCIDCSDEKFEKEKDKK